MVSRDFPPVPLLGACTALWRGERILLALRDRAPNASTWAMPGGLVEVGETLEEAARREVLEETGLTIGTLAFNRFHEVIRKSDDGRTALHFVLAMFVARADEGEPIAGDDAAAVAWYTLAELDDVPLTGDTLVFAKESRELLATLT